MSRKNSKNKNKPHEWSEKEKIAAMRTLEHNSFNYTQTSKDLGVSRQTLYKWKDEYWDKYQDERQYYEGYVETVQAKMLVENENTDALLAATRKAYAALIDRINTDADFIASLTPNQLSDLLKNIAPYSVPKQVAGIAPGGGDEEESFWNNLMESFKKK